MTQPHAAYGCTSGSRIDDSRALIAAADLGSNSFHMVVVRVERNRFSIVEHLRESVCLASGLLPGDKLDLASQQRALACLQRFGRRLRDFDVQRVRAVGTSVWRQANNVEDFLDAAQSAFGHPVSVIPGQEEARLIYLGVSRNIGGAAARTLVVDIGGGSTELIVGEGDEPRQLASLPLGCVGFTRRFFADGKLTHGRFAQARNAARVELESVVEGFRCAGWVRAIGSSGMVRASGAVAAGLGLVQSGVTEAALECMLDELVKAGSIGALSLPGLNQERSIIFPGGLAILIELFRGLAIERMEMGGGALREGLLHDMLRGPQLN